MKKLRKWNWGAFYFILVVTCLSAAANESVNTLPEYLSIVIGFGIPVGLLVAYELKEE